MYIYLDESGDLGFREGGSKYFTIAFIVTTDPVSLKGCVRRVKVRYHIPREVELKGNTTQLTIEKDLLSRLSRLELEIHAITVMKENVQPKL